MTDQTQTIRIVIDARPAKDGGEDAKRALQGIEQQTSKMGAALDRMGDKLSMAVGHLKGMAVAAAIAWGVSFAGHALAAASGLEELSEQLGITTRFMQASQMSAAQNGASLAQLEAGYGKFSQKMGEAADGTKAMVDALQALGVKNLDVAGKLRPTEDIIQDVAAAIVAIEDPAKKAAAAVDFFGKSGARLLPMMGDLAKGSDYMAAQAERLGTMIDEKAIKKLDEWGDAGARNALKLRATFVNGVADAITWLEKLEERFSKSAKADNGWLKGLGKDLITFVDDFNVAGVRASAQFFEAFAALPEQMGKLFTDAWNRAKTASATGLNDLTAWLAEKAPAWMGITGTNVQATPSPGGGASLGDWSARVVAAGDAAANQMLARQAAARTQAERQAFLGRQAGFEDDETRARVGRGINPSTTGAGLSTVRGAGGETGKRIGQLLSEGRLAAEYGHQMADAARNGAAAVEELEARYKATKAAQDAYGESAKNNAPAVEQLAAKLYELGRAADEAKALTEFRLGTDSLRNENQLLEAEVRLANELPEIRTRELAILKVTQEVKKKGLEDSREDIDARIAAVTQQDLLKQKIEDTKKASDLWLEPVKGALQSLQSTAADAWAQILEGGTISFQSLGDVFKKTITRMAAEFLALATVRPVMSVLVQGASSMGFMSAGQASAMGYGGSGGGSFGGLPSFGGGGMFGGLGDWLNTPFTGPYAGMSPSSMQGVPMLSPSMMNPGSWGITPLQGLGAAAGLGMGAYQLATSRSTASTIGGIGTMLGAGISLIPGMAPIGMGISLLSSILPGLFGGGEAPPLPPLAGANIRFDPSASGYVNTATTQNGGAGLGSQYGGIASTLDALYAATGGTINPGLAMSGSIWNNQREGTTSTYVISPTQGSLQLSEGGGDQSAAIDRMIAKIFYMTATTPGALTGASSSLGTSLGNVEPTSVAQVQALLELIRTYDQLGKVTPSAQSALEQINAQFENLTAGAQQYGLSLAPIQAEQQKLTTRYAQDFIDGLIDPMAVALRAFEDERKDILASVDYIRANTDVHVDMARINEALLRREAALKEQLYGGAVDSLEAAIRRLTYGDLSNSSPTTTLEGIRASYMATLAQASGGNAEAISRLAGEGIAYADAGRSNFASSPQYQALVEEIRRNLAEVQAAIQGPASPGTPLGAANDQFTQAILAAMTQSQREAQTTREENTTLRQEMASLTAEVRRLVAASGTRR